MRPLSRIQTGNFSTGFVVWSRIRISRVSVIIPIDDGESHAEFLGRDGRRPALVSSAEFLAEMPKDSLAAESKREKVAGLVERP